MPDIGKGGVGGQSVANITHHLKGIDFPCNRQDLINQAKKNGAGQDVISALQGLADRQYSSMADVMQSYGKEKAA